MRYYFSIALLLCHILTAQTLLAQSLSDFSTVITINDELLDSTDIIEELEKLPTTLEEEVDEPIQKVEKLVPDTSLSPNTKVLEEEPTAEPEITSDTDTAPVQASPKEQPQTSNIQENLSWNNGSIFFPQEVLNKLYLILEGTELPDSFIQNELEQEDKKDFSIDRKKIRITRLVPNLYLESILFFDQKNWSFWLNGERYSSTSTLPYGLTVDTIDSDMISFIWHEPNFKDITPEWQNEFIPYTDIAATKTLSSTTNSWDYMSADQKIFIESTTGKIRFTIGQNQSFQSYNLAIIEGNSESFYAHFKPGQNEKAQLLPLDYDLSQLDKEENQL